jgi:hypothetical protein
VSTGRVYISRDVVFDETVFPFKSLHPNAGALIRKQILLLDPSLCNFERGTTLLMILQWKILMLLTHMSVLFLILCRIQLVEIQQLAKIWVKTVLKAVHMTLLCFKVKITVAPDPMMILSQKQPRDCRRSRRDPPVPCHIPRQALRRERPACMRVVPPLLRVRLLSDRLRLALRPRPPVLPHHWLHAPQRILAPRLAPRPRQERQILLPPAPLDPLRPMLACLSLWHHLVRVRILALLKEL